MPDSGLVVGIDLATATARAVVLELGTPAVLVAEATTPLPHPVSGQAGEREQKPFYAQAIGILMARVSAALTASQRRAVRSISVSGTSGTVLAVDQTGQPLGAALMYNDNRAQDQLVRCEHDEVGLRPTATLARLAWLSAQYPKAHFVTSPDLALWYLAGEPLRVSDTSHWIKAGIDAETLEWPARSLESLEIDQAKLPKLSKPGRSVGTLAAYLAHSWGLRPEVSLVLGMTDGCTSQIATGATQVGDSVGVLGTTFVLKAVWSEAIEVPQMGIYSHLAPDGSFWPGGAANTGAGAMPRHFPRHDPIALEHWGEQASAYGPSTYVSYSLPGVGERFPFVSATVESFATAEPADDVDRYRSFLEGVAFAERYGRQILGEAGVVFNRHFVSGGASRSASWNRIRATVLGEPLYRASFGDSAIGAAFLAGFPTQKSKWADYIPRLIPAPVVVEPFERESSALESRYGQFLEEIERRGLN